MLTIEHVNKFYQQKQVLKQINLTINKGEIVCLLGHSGCGKSTLLRVIGGLINPDSGIINLKKRKCAMVFQEPRLLPWLTVAENLSLALPFWQPKRQKMAKVLHQLKQVQLENSEYLMPRELSGGMAQRVGIARALLREPDILLLDEPFAALDAITRADLQQKVKQLITKQHKTCLFVTHDIDEALLLGQRIIVMQQGELIYQYDLSNNNGKMDDSIKNTLKIQNINNEKQQIKQQILQQLHYL